MGMRIVVVETRMRARTIIRAGPPSSDVNYVYGTYVLPHRVSDQPSGRSIFEQLELFNPMKEKINSFAIE